MSKHPQPRLPYRWGGRISRSKIRRVNREIAAFRKTGVVSAWLAQKAAKNDWVMYHAFPALAPPAYTLWTGQWTDQYKHTVTMLFANVLNMGFSK